MSAFDGGRPDEGLRQGLVVLARALGDHEADLGEDLLDLLRGQRRILKVDRVLEARAIAAEVRQLSGQGLDATGAGGLVQSAGLERDEVALQ